MGTSTFSDVSVVNCRIADGGLSFGTNAQDASITIRDCTFSSTDFEARMPLPGFNVSRAQPRRHLIQFSRQRAQVVTRCFSTLHIAEVGRGHFGDLRDVARNILGH